MPSSAEERFSDSAKQSWKALLPPTILDFDLRKTSKQDKNSNAILENGGCTTTANALSVHVIHVHEYSSMFVVWHLKIHLSQ